MRTRLPKENPSRWGRAEVIFIVNAVIALAVLTPHVLVHVLPRDLYNLWNNPNVFSASLAAWWFFATIWGLPVTILGLAATFVLADSGEYLYAGISLILAIACSVAWMPLFSG